MWANLFLYFHQVLFATGDVLAQQVVEKRGIQKQDFARTGRMALYGGGTKSNCS
jgi:hypothetical protein